MTGLFPVPTGRTSDLLFQQRLLAQLQSDQLRLLELQDQISTGRRFSVPSEDAPASIRAINLQRLLEQREQSSVNLTTSQSYLGATENAISNVSQLIAEVRGLAVAVSDSTTSEIERDAASQEIERIINQLFDVANEQFRGRYLFSGSTTNVKPIENSGEFIKYVGNEGKLQSFADIDLLFETNVHANQVFGVVSSEIKGTADLNPVLTAETRLADLRGGIGVGAGSFVITDGATSQTIDISTAETVGDVVRLIEANPPTGRTVTARITATGLTIDIDDAGGGNLTIQEVGGGTTAAELGILEINGTGVAPIVGQDLNPRLRLTTKLSNILGVRATAVVESTGANNDIFLEARLRGAAGNGATVQFVDDARLLATPGLTAGNETATFSTTAVAARAALTFSGNNNNLVLTAASAGVDFNNVQIDIADAGAIGNAATVNYNPTSRVLTIGVDTAGNTEVQTIINELATDGTFTAAYDASDAGDGGFVATATISAADVGVVQGNTTNSGGAANTIFVNIANGTSTANNVVTALQGNVAVNALFDVRLDGKGHVEYRGGRHRAGRLGGNRGHRRRQRRRIRPKHRSANH